VVATALVDRVKETTLSTGTAAVALAGAAQGYQSFAGSFVDGALCFYCIADQQGANWEVGKGSYQAAGNALARTTILSSSNGNALVNFPAGTKDVFVTAPAAALPLLSQANNFTANQTVTGNLSVTGTLGNTSLFGGLRVQDGPDATYGVNMLGGAAGNAIAAGATACVIAGGGAVGASDFANKILSTGATTTHDFYSVIGGGYDNRITSGYPSTIAGGAHNRINTATADAGRTVTLPGYVPNLSCDHATVIGGSFQAIYNSHYTTICGGTQNNIGTTTQSDGSTIVGGANNTVNGGYHTASGSANTISGPNYCTAFGANHQLSATGSTAFGENNTVSGQDGFAAGYNNSLSGARSVVIGESNVCNGTSPNDDYLAVFGFTHTVGTTASARFSLVVGRQNTCQVESATVLGKEAKATVIGGLTMGNGKFAAVGDTQTTVVSIKAQTTSATGVEMLAQGLRLTLPFSTTWTFSALLVARRTDAADNAGFKLEGVIQKGTLQSSTALVGTVTTTTLGTTDGTWTATATADTTNGSLKITVAGAAGKTVLWSGRVELAEATG